MTEDVTIALAGGGNVSALALTPEEAGACFVLAHGAGAGMRHPFMAAVAGGLATRGIATLRYDFPYMERGGGRPDSAKTAAACVRAAVAAAAALMPTLPLFAGGKSFGGRITSQAQAQLPLPGVHGLIFLGFPLHAAKQPSIERAAHLAEVRLPMLFLQGARDSLAERALIAAEVSKLSHAALAVTEDADHSFHVPKRSGRTDAEVMDAMLDRIVTWIGAVVGAA